MISTSAFLIPVALAILALIPAFISGRANTGSERSVSAWILAAVMNVLAVPAPFAGYLALLLIPASCFCIAAAVAGIAGRRGWIHGLLAFPWFLAPSLGWWVVTATPDQVAAYGRIPREALLLTLPFGLLGALAAEGTRALVSAGGRRRDRA